MIRHPVGDDYLLFKQDDHARLSGALAARWGNGSFAQPIPFAAVVDAVTLHDRGWAFHDELPTLNETGAPLHVFETPPGISTKVWAESVRRARTTGAYSALLVSLHVFSLSALAQQHYGNPADRGRDALAVFELNKFQQLQIETQEDLRRELGLRTDMPLQLGLAPLGTSDTEDLLRCNYQVLKALDQVSLALLCAGRQFASIEGISPRPGAEALDLRIEYVRPWTASIRPWPFTDSRIEWNIPFRRVHGPRFSSLEDFRDAYSNSAGQLQAVTLVRS